MLRYATAARTDDENEEFMAVTGDPFDLNRFLEAQAGTYDRALAELRHGRKTRHWMWFIFPQIAGLGSSEMSRRYAIRSVAEAAAYLDHPVLGPRLRACVGAVHDLKPTTAEAVFGGIDAQKFRSSLTLFNLVAPDPLFSAALQRWFGGEADARTLHLAKVGSRKAEPISNP